MAKAGKEAAKAAGAVQAWADASAGRSRGSLLGLSGAVGHALADIGTILIILLSPTLTHLIYIINRHHGGDLTAFGLFLRHYGLRGMWSVWPVPWGAKGAEAWLWVVAFGAVQALMQVVVPGKTFHGPISPKGNVPVYKANGPACFGLTAALFVLGTRLAFFDPARLYDIFGEVLAVLNVSAWALCATLTFKGLNFPSSSDHGSTGSIVYDFYWGTELYPRIGALFDIKTWTNCRMGMMAWTFIAVCFACKQAELTGSVSNGMLVAVVLTGVYNLKFFLWETGYWKTMDIAHDRAGFYLCWGCLNWVPGVYTSQVLYMTTHPQALSQPAAVALLVAGAAAIYVNWEADHQRQLFRETNGRCLIWSQPPKFVRAKYTTGDGLEKQSLLLASGWWGCARHFHYVPEVLASICWTLPASFSHILPWFYTIFLTVLLLDRLFRDDARCRAKYGTYWTEYCKLVPRRLIPLVF